MTDPTIPTDDPANPDGGDTLGVTADDITDQPEDPTPLDLVGDPRFDVNPDGSPR